MNKILVTGASGFIGTNLVRRLAAEGESVRVLLRQPSLPMGLDTLPLEIAVGDVLDQASLQHAMQGIDRVYHVAGFVQLGPFATRDLQRINVTGTENVCHAAKAAGVRRLVHTSTVSTMGAGTAEQPADETSVYDPKVMHVPYFVSKRAGELAALQAGSDGSMQVVVVNPAFVLGAWDRKPTSGELILWSAKYGGLPLYARGSLNAVDVDDVVAGHIAAMQHGRPGERYILGHENLSHQQLLEAIADELGLRRPRMAMMIGGARLFTIWGDLLGPYFPRAFANFNTPMLRVTELQQYVRCDKAKRELGLPQTPVREAIRKAHAWFVETGRLRARL